MVRIGGMKVEVRGTSPYWLSRNGGVETMAMPQRDDSPTPRLRRTGTIEAIKRQPAEKKAAEEKRRPRRVPASRIVGSKGRERGTDRNAARRPAGTGEKGMGESPAPVQAPRAVALTGCGEGVDVV